MQHKKVYFRFLCLVGLLSLNSQVQAASESVVYVQVKESRLRSEPQFWAPSVASISYGAKLSALGTAPGNSSWLKVKLDNSEGYVHASAVTKRKIVLSSTAASDKAVSGESVVLAGKGFNRQVENSYATSKGLDFKVVDEVEQVKVDSAQGAAFVKEGKLS